MATHFPPSANLSQNHSLLDARNCPNVLGTTETPSKKEFRFSDENQVQRGNSPLPELPLITFDTNGQILNYNDKAREMFQLSPRSKVQDMMFAPNYFLEMTHSSFLANQQKELIWSVDLCMLHNCFEASKVKVTQAKTPGSFCAQIDLLAPMPKKNPIHTVHNACVVKFSSEFTVIAAEGTERILGVKEEELLHKQSEALFDRVSWEELNKNRSNEPGSVLSMKLCHQTKNCGEISLKVSGIRNEDGSWHCVIRKYLPDISPDSQSFQPNKMLRSGRISTPPLSPLQERMTGTCSRSSSPSLTIDLSKVAPRPVSEVTTPRTHLPKYTILVVDDTQINQIVMKRLLTSLNQTVVHVAGNGKEALAFLAVAEPLPDLIITDRNMPEMGGLELLKAIRSTPRLKDLYCILWSDDRKGIDQEMIDDLKIKQFMLKPAKREDVEEKLYTFSSSLGNSSPRKRTLEQHIDSNMSDEK
ncbi:MAG: response regulator [Verrucomicrobia bacterium]|nr:response regulator [Verrucomicrobiota bacterium]